MRNAEKPIQVSCRNLWKIFGPTPDEVLAALTEGADSKASILAETGHVIAVRGVSLDVVRGETFVVMGLSGSGKSTFLRCIPRLIEPTAGSVAIDGQDIAHLDTRGLRKVRRHKMSMVFQHFGLLPHRTILDNVAFGLEVQGIKKDERYATARRVLDMVNLTGWEDHRPSQLSGGMQQRVGLARALAVDPEILLFDEPFSALDPLIRREMQDELIGLQKQMHKTLLFITHDFAEAIKLGDHIAIMKDGEFVQVGTAEELVLHPADDYVAAFTRDVPRTQVLTARSVMEPLALDAPGSPATDSITDNVTVDVHTRLGDLIPVVVNAAAPITVVDAHARPVGRIGREEILRALAGSGDEL